MVPAGLFDLFFLLPAVVVLTFGIAFLARGIRRPDDKPVTGGAPARSPGVSGRRSAIFRLAGIGASLAVLTAIGLVIATQLGAFDPGIAAPSAAQAAGRWVGSRGATLALAADGTFTARHLPAGVGDWTSGPVPVSGGGTWHVGRFDPSTPTGVILSFSEGSQVELQLERDGSSLAMFYDLGDPDEGWSGQFRFVKQ